MKTCVVCGSLFAAHGNAKTCSSVCGKTNQKAARKAWYHSEKTRAIRKVRERSEKFKTNRKAAYKAWYHSEKGKSYRKAYRQTSKRKAYVKAYQKTDKYKAKQKAYKQSERGKMNRAMARRLLETKRAIIAVTFKLQRSLEDAISASQSTGDAAGQSVCPHVKHGTAGGVPHVAEAFPDSHGGGGGALPGVRGSQH